MGPGKGKGESHAADGAPPLAAAIPVALFVAVQRHIVQGLTAGAVKT
ncbi:hypothetical protein U7230_08940 [Carboxydochorda subterranea]|uniref:Uncharacterized protein n=1 Tax=Carboxydichorda subterranea TaxID=3109565 RepID=A0ABZ1BVN7_9FIRM|nr:hypothetical protein [Limnochorda sp. L945t]WRP16228.1 hypothetical protein U7230_08940 [Limnochorda sp. L945t]